MSTTPDYYCSITVRTDSDNIQQVTNGGRDDFLELLIGRDGTGLIVDC